MNQLLKFPMSDLYASLHLPMHSVILNGNGIGFRCSKDAVLNLKNSSSGTDVYSIMVLGEIIWVSGDEFHKYNLVEYPIPNELTIKGLGTYYPNVVWSIRHQMFQTFKW